MMNEINSALLSQGIVDLMAYQIELIRMSNRKGNYADIKAEKTYCTLREQAKLASTDIKFLDKRFMRGTRLLKGIRVDDRARSLGIEVMEVKQ